MSVDLYFNASDKMQEFEDFDSINDCGSHERMFIFSYLIKGKTRAHVQTEQRTDARADILSQNKFEWVRCD